MRAADVVAVQLVGDVTDEAGVDGERAANEDGVVRAVAAAAPVQRAGAVDRQVVVGLEGGTTVGENGVAGTEIEGQGGDAVIEDLAEVGLAVEVDRVDADAGLIGLGDVTQGTIRIGRAEEIDALVESQ